MKIFLIVLAFIAAGFAYWAFSPLFIDPQTNDELPTSKLPVDPNASDDETISEPQLESDQDAANQTSEPTTLTDEPAERLYPITGTPQHPASGNVRVVVTPDEQIIRYEDYNGTNGPDLKIYLASDLEATEIIDLGPARAHQGNINYSVPLDVDIDEYRYVLTWSETLDVLFDYAEID